ncbi:MAG: sulfatase-like hydrolase/transferase [Acidobacteriia bacterium]|nr:sulfatase-like hydrolase/transferase [Terriglobia bacterium]
MKAARILMIGWLATAGFGALPPQKKPSPPDVFLVTIDTLRADHVHCYGDEAIQTPALDSLAKDGIRFAEAFTPSPITNTSHTTILTGLLPSSHGVTDFAVPLAATHLTWAELLKPKGYHTAAFIGAVILDSKSLAPGLDRGFDFYDNFPEHSQTKSRWGRVERRGAEVVQHAETWLTAHPAGPHFVWVHLYDPHDPYEPPAPYSETYKDRLYDGEIAYADSVLANFLGYLKKHGWYENSVVIVVGDHGEGLGEHHEDTHGIFLYDSTTHVPLIVKLPFANAGKTVDAQVRTTDILPTVLDVLQIGLPGRLDGKSLKPYFATGETADRTAIGETDYPLRFGWAPLRSVRAEGFKFIEAPRPELYDLRADPGELKNGYEPANATAQKLRGLLAPLKPRASGETASGAADTQGNNLQALGYVSGSNAAGGANPEALPDPKDKIEEQNLLHTAMLATDDDRPADARSALEKVLQIDPKSPTALRQLGELELHAGDYVKAADHLKGAREARPDDSTAAFYEGQAREKMGDLAGARDALEASLKLTPGQLPARLLLGQVYLGLKDPKAAEDQFEAALLVQPDSVEAQLGVAKAQIAEGSFADAVQQLEPLSKTQAGNADVFELLAQAYKGLGKSEEAQQAAIHAKSLRAKPEKP